MKFTGLFACFTLVLALATTLTAEETIWSGGLGTISDQVRVWRPATLELKEFGERIEGKLKTEPSRIYKIEGTMQDNEVTLTLNRRDQQRVFRGQHDQGVLSLAADDGEVPSTLIVRCVTPLSQEQLSPLAGIYEFEDGHRVAIRVAPGSLAWTDYRNGTVRRLYPVSSSEFIAGSALMIPDSGGFVVRFVEDTQDDDDVVAIEVQSSPELAERIGKRRPRGKTLDFEYSSFDDTKIRGSLYLPAGKGPHPAIVWVHGSGRVTRENSGSWPIYFSDLGFAVLAVDKRGMGESEGIYHLPNGGGRDNFPHMRRRSRDVAAAVSALASRADIDADNIGLVGASQAGWVIPMTAGQAKLSFAIVLSGGATPLSVEGRFSRLASERMSGADLRPVPELVEELRSYQPKDPGINAELQRMEFPCLWLYGLKDRSNPSQLCSELINEIAWEHNRDFTVKLFPEGNHSLLICRFGGSAEIGSLDRLVPGMHATIEDWLTTNGLMPESSR